MKPAINFITLAVGDLDRAMAFYRDGLGFPTEGIQEGFEDHCLFALDNDFSLVLYRRDAFLGVADLPAEAGRAGGAIISHFAGSREEVDVILETAVAAGAAKLGEPRSEWWGYSAFFADPDGHIWEIVHVPADQ